MSISLVRERYERSSPRIWGSRLVTIVGLAAIIVGAIYLKSIDKGSLERWSFWVLGGGVVLTIFGLIGWKVIRPLGKVAFSELENKPLLKWKELIDIRKTAKEGICKYSQKQLTASQKMEKQTTFARESQNPDSQASFNLPSNLSAVDRMEAGEGFGLAIAKGKRSYMEDVAFGQKIVLSETEALIYCICDGHGDDGTAGHLMEEQLGNLIVDILAGKELTDENIGDAFTTATEALHMEFLINTDKYGGATMTCALRIGGVIYTANVGDSRTVHVTTQNVVQLSEDANVDGNAKSGELFWGLYANSRFCKGHHPYEEDIRSFETRDKNGNFKTVHTCRGLIKPRPGNTTLGIGRGFINMGRGIGDSELSCRPKISRIESNTGYLVLASDGLTGALSNQEVQQAIILMQSKGMNEAEMAAYLLQAAYNKGSTDNISVIVVRL